MRLKKFTKEQMASLINNGFEIVVDQESAIITGDLTLEVFSPVRGGMSVRITLPNEKTIEFQTSAANLIGDWPLPAYR
jgi:hypothetical protein